MYGWFDFNHFSWAGSDSVIRLSVSSVAITLAFHTIVSSFSLDKGSLP